MSTPLFSPHFQKLNLSPFLLQLILFPRLPSPHRDGRILTEASCDNHPRAHFLPAITFPSAHLGLVLKIALQVAVSEFEFGTCPQRLRTSLCPGNLTLLTPLQIREVSLIYSYSLNQREHQRRGTSARLDAMVGKICLQTVA